MTKITKPTPVTNYKITSKSHAGTLPKPTEDVGVIHQKSDAHNSPDHRSGNEHHLMDTFYENTYNLKHSFNRVTDLNEEGESLKHYFKAHKREILLGATSLIEDINRLIQECVQCDFSLGTHFYFLLESIIVSFEKDLNAIGIHFFEDCLYLNAKFFYETMVEAHEKFDFIFTPNSGLMDQCVLIHEKIRSVRESHFTEGQFIDIKG